MVAKKILLWTVLILASIPFFMMVFCLNKFMHVMKLQLMKIMPKSTYLNL